jgi:hypothetical protein
MDNKIFEKLEELSLGQQRIEIKLEAHLNEHTLSFKRLTQIYVPTLALLVPTISAVVSWATHKNLKTY